jgi:hypothetical protein
LALDRSNFNLLRIEEELSTVHLRLARVFIVKRWERTERSEGVRWRGFCGWGFAGSRAPGEEIFSGSGEGGIDCAGGEWNL